MTPACRAAFVLTAALQGQHEPCGMFDAASPMVPCRPEKIGFSRTAFS